MKDRKGRPLEIGDLVIFVISNSGDGKCLQKLYRVIDSQAGELWVFVEAEIILKGKEFKGELRQASLLKYPHDLPFTLENLRMYAGLEGVEVYGP